MPRQKRPYRNIPGKPEVPREPDIYHPDHYWWQFHAANAVADWLRQNHQEFVAATPMPPVYVIATDGDRLVIDIMPDDRGRPAFRLIRHPDGSLRSPDRENQILQQEYHAHALQRETRIGIDLMQECARRIPPGLMNHLAYPESFAGLPQRIKEHAATIAVDLGHYAIVDGNRQNLDDSPTAAIRDVLKRHFIKPPLLRLARQCLGSNRIDREYAEAQTVAVTHYNFVLRHRTVVTRLLDHSRNALLWQTQSQSHRLLKAKAGRLNPAAVIRAAKDDLGITDPAQWSAFLSLPAVVLRSYSGERIALACEILAKANPTDDPTLQRQKDKRYDILETCDPERFSPESKWRHGDPKARWAQVCGALLRGRETYQLQLVADAFHAAVAENRPWPSSGDYHVHANKASRWHQIQAQQRYQDAARARRETVWDGMIPTHDSDDRKRRCRPLTSPIMLADSARSMENCLATFADKCASGNSLVFEFSLNDPKTPTGKPVAAASLNRDTTQDQWRIGQIAGPRNTGAPDWVREWTRQLLDILNRTGAAPEP